jgi:predicted membrane metal-binding protein
MGKSPEIRQVLLRQYSAQVAAPTPIIIFSFFRYSLLLLLFIIALLFFSSFPSLVGFFLSFDGENSLGSGP